MTERQSIAVQVRKARDLVNEWPQWKQDALERQINSRRASPPEHDETGEGGTAPSEPSAGQRPESDR
jgi:hypothetical protein